MKIAIVLGTRPEIIKMSPVIRECEKRGVGHFILHTGQHYDYSMDKIFFEELGLNPESINLNVGSGTHAETTGRTLMGIEKILTEESPDCVLVQGDTNTVLSGSLVSVKLHIKLGHVEAGLRSYDRRMPEEYNRIIADHLSDFLFAPTKKSAKVLHGESLGKRDLLHFDGTYRQEIHMTGNTIVDAINQNIEKSKKESKIYSKLGIDKNNYFLVTAHREENVDYKKNLIGILNGLEKISNFYGTNIVYPIHPRTRKRIKEFGLESCLTRIKNLKITEPLGFFDLLTLESDANLILTDSGGIQEEACSLKVPCVVLRDRSDRSESTDIGASILAGCDPKKIFESSKIMINKKRKWKNPFGDGKASKRIINILSKNL